MLVIATVKDIHRLICLSDGTPLVSSSGKNWCFTHNVLQITTFLYVNGQIAVYPAVTASASCTQAFPQFLALFAYFLCMFSGGIYLFTAVYKNASYLS